MSNRQLSSAVDSSTMVMIPSETGVSEVSISELKVGDLVRSFNMTTRKIEDKEVTSIILLSSESTMKSTVSVRPDNSSTVLNHTPGLLIYSPDTDSYDESPRVVAALSYITEQSSEFTTVYQNVKERMLSAGVNPMLEGLLADLDQEKLAFIVPLLATDDLPIAEVTVYSLSVADNNNYFANTVLVHS